MAKKSYGKTPDGKSIIDALVEKHAKEAEAGYDVDEMLERRQNPMLRVLASAPLDDETSEADEDDAAAEALAAYQRGEGITSDRLRAELGLD